MKNCPFTRANVPYRFFTRLSATTRVITSCCLEISRRVVSYTVHDYGVGDNDVPSPVPCPAGPRLWPHATSSLRTVLSCTHCCSVFEFQHPFAPIGLGHALGSTAPALPSTISYFYCAICHRAAVPIDATRSLSCSFEPSV